MYNDIYKGSYNFLVSQGANVNIVHHQTFIALEASYFAKALYTLNNITESSSLR